MEHIVRLEQDREALRSLHNLYWIRRLHGPRVTPRQAPGSVVESFSRPLFTSPGCVRQLSGAFLDAAFRRSATTACLRISGDVRDARPVPYSVEVRLAI